MSNPDQTPATIEAEKPAAADMAIQMLNIPDFSSMGDEAVVPQCDLENIELCEACQ